MKHCLNVLYTLAVLATATAVYAKQPQTIRQCIRHQHNLTIARKRDELHLALIGDESLVKIEDVKRLLDAGVPVNAVFSDAAKERPITEAAGYGNMEAVQLLLKRGADVNARDGEGQTALRTAAGLALVDSYNIRPSYSTFPTPAQRQMRTANYVKVLRLLLRHGANPNLTDPHGVTPLDAAAFAGHPSVVAALLDGHANPNIRDRFGRTPIEWASYNGHLQIVQLLRAHGARINAQYGLPRPQQGRLDAQLVSYLKDTEHLDKATLVTQVKSFLAKGADPNACSIWLAKDSLSYGGVEIANVTTPLLSCDSASAFALLLAHGADVDRLGGPLLGPSLTTTRQTLALEAHKHNGHLQRAGERLLAAAANTNPAFTRLVLRYGAPVNARNGESKTPIMLTHSESILKILLAHGADINARDSNGETPLMQAANQTWGEGSAAACDAPWAEVLLRHGADTNRRDHNGNTVLMLLAKQGEYGEYNRGRPITIARLLLAHGARTGLRNKSGHTALQIARWTSASSLTRLVTTPR